MVYQALTVIMTKTGKKDYSKVWGIAQKALRGVQAVAKPVPPPDVNADGKVEPIESFVVGLADYISGLGIAQKGLKQNGKGVPSELGDLKGQASALLRRICKVYGFPIERVFALDPPTPQQVMSFVTGIGNVAGTVAKVLGLLL